MRLLTVEVKYSVQGNEYSVHLSTLADGSTPFSTGSSFGTATPDWITYSPLPPLFLLLFTGLYMFALPYFGRSHTRPENA